MFFCWNCVLLEHKSSTITSIFFRYTSVNLWIITNIQDLIYGNLFNTPWLWNQTELFKILNNLYILFVPERDRLIRVSSCFDGPIRDKKGMPNPPHFDKMLHVACFLARLVIPLHTKPSCIGLAQPVLSLHPSRVHNQSCSQSTQTSTSNTNNHGVFFLHSILAQIPACALVFGRAFTHSSALDGFCRLWPFSASR